MYNSILKLTFHCHQYLEELLLLHQEALLLQKLSLARQFLELFDEGIKNHIDVEDSLIIPQLDEAKINGQWPSLMYYKEHEKILKLLAKTGHKMRLLVEQGDAATAGADVEAAVDNNAQNLRRQILTFLDEEKTLKGVLEHHEEREEQALLIDLDEQLEETVKSALIEEVAGLWQNLQDQQSDKLKALLLQL